MSCCHPMHGAVGISDVSTDDRFSVESSGGEDKEQEDQDEEEEEEEEEDEDEEEKEEMEEEEEGQEKEGDVGSAICQNC